MRRCDREGVAWPPPVYGPPRPSRRCGWCDRTDDAVAFGYDYLPPACPDHREERLRTLDDIAAMRRGPTTDAATAARVYAAGEAFVRGNAGDGWTLYPQRCALPSPASATAAAAERGR